MARCLGARSVRSCYSGQSDAVEPQAHEKSAGRGYRHQRKTPLSYHDRVGTAGKVMADWEDAAVRRAFIQSVVDRKATNEQAEQEESA